MNQRPEEIKVLIAANPESASSIQNALGEGFLLSFANSMVEVFGKLYHRMDIIVCGLNFNESRMFDFLRYAKLDLHAQEMPFICVNAVQALSPALRQSVEIASHALGAVGFVDLCQWQSQFGLEETRRKFRQLLNQHSNRL